jgi:4-amino-4-deoxy-L-arabinose transferase-like glycosyltransferase
MYEHGYKPLMLLMYSRLIQVIVILVLFLLLYYLLQRFIPKLGAAFAVVFVSFDPYYLGLTRMLTHEAMVALFVLVSLMALAVYLLRDRRVVFLLISGVMAGFAQLTKSSAIAMLAGVGILLLMQIIQDRQQGWAKAVLNSTKTFVLWLVFLAVTYFIFWPGMWVAPGKMLYQVYGNAFSYAFQGARLTVTEDLDVSQFNLNTNLAGIWSVAKVIFYRTTPWTWLGILLGFALPFTRNRELARQNRLFFTLLLTNAIAFILLIGIAQGRNSPHYVLTSYVSLNLLAALGWLHSFQWIASRFSTKTVHIQYAGLIMVLLLQVWSAMSFFPYYFTYRNPILQSAGWYANYPQKPYGEGLEYAADYLAQLPNAKDSTALVYYSRGCFSYYYPGRSVSFRPYYVDGDHAVDLLRNLDEADYLVVYYANQVQLQKYDAYLDILSALEPIHVIWMDGYEYVRIYKMDSFTPEILEALENL